MVLFFECIGFGKGVDVTDQSVTEEGEEVVYVDRESRVAENPAELGDEVNHEEAGITKDAANWDCEQQNNPVAATGSHQVRDAESQRQSEGESHDNTQTEKALPLDAPEERQDQGELPQAASKEPGDTRKSADNDANTARQGPTKSVTHKDTKYLGDRPGKSKPQVLFKPTASFASAKSEESEEIKEITRLSRIPSKSPGRQQPCPEKLIRQVSPPKAKRRPEIPVETFSPSWPFNTLPASPRSMALQASLERKNAKERGATASSNVQDISHRRTDEQRQKVDMAKPHNVPSDTFENMQQRRKATKAEIVKSPEGKNEFPELITISKSPLERKKAKARELNFIALSKVQDIANLRGDEYKNKDDTTKSHNVASGALETIQRRLKAAKDEMINLSEGEDEKQIELAKLIETLTSAAKAVRLLETVN